MFKLNKEKIAYRGSVLRESCYLSIDDLSKKTGLDSKSLLEFERKKAFPNMPELIELCKFFNVSASYLMGVNNIKGEFNVISPKFEFYEHLEKIAANKKVNLSSVTDTDIDIKNLSLKRLLARSATMTFKNLYLIAITLDVSLDFLIGSCEFENWIFWAQKYHENFYNELVQAGQAFTEREYFFKNIHQIRNDVVTESNPYRLRQLVNEHDKDLDFYIKMVDTSEGTFRHWLNGKGLSNINQLAKLAEFFDVNCAYLLGLTDVRTSNSTYKISVNLIQTLNKLNISIAEFKNRMGMQAVTFTKYSAANPPTYLKTYMAMAEALDVSIDYLLGFTPYKNWETDYARAINPQLWIAKGISVCVIDSETHKKLYNLLCVETSNLKCVNQDLEIINLDDEFIEGKEFIELFPQI